MPDNHKEIDLREDLFSIVKERRIPLGYCAIVVNEEVVYAGPIEHSPDQPQTGWVMFLHPDDFEELDKFYRKEMN